jgi:hypothetical protein
MDTPPIENKPRTYSPLDLLKTLVCVCLPIGGLGLAQTSGTFNLMGNGGAGVLLLPMLAGFGIGFGNRAFLPALASLLLAGSWFLFVLVCFAGLILAASLGLESEHSNPLFVFMIENLPFLLGGGLLYKLYASLSGAKAWWLWLSLVIWNGLFSLMLFKALISQELVLLLLFFGVNTLLLSLLHFTKNKTQS